MTQRNCQSAHQSESGVEIIYPSPPRWAVIFLICVALTAIADVGLKLKNSFAPPPPPAMTIYPECDMQVALIKELQAKVKALEDLNPRKVQISTLPDPPPFPPAKRPERSILIDPNSRIIGGEKTSRAYWGCPCLRVAWNRGNAAEEPEHADDQPGDG
jgi:hypothetical protein